MPDQVQSLSELISGAHPPTPAQALYTAAISAGLVRNKREFADAVQVDAGNIYNYLAPAGVRRHIPANSRSLRRWGENLSRRSEGRLRVRVTENEEGATELLIEDGEGSITRASSLAGRSNHICGHEDGRLACDELLARLKAFHPEVVRRDGLHHCAFVVGREVLWVEHDVSTSRVAALPIHTADEGDALTEVLLQSGLCVEKNTSRNRNGGGRRAVRHLRVHLEPGHGEEAAFARSLARHLRWWQPRDRSREWPMPEEPPGGFWEGGRVTVTVNRYERDARARLICIGHYGWRCAVCDMSFEERYGAVGLGYIHVHHVRPLHQVGGRYRLDPVRDLRPVCANCHSMIHRDGGPPRDIAELRRELARNSKRAP